MWPVGIRDEGPCAGNRGHDAGSIASVASVAAIRPLLVPIIPYEPSLACGHAGHGLPITVALPDRPIGGGATQTSTRAAAAGLSLAIVAV